MINANILNFLVHPEAHLENGFFQHYHIFKGSKRFWLRNHRESRFVEDQAKVECELI